MRIEPVISLSANDSVGPSRLRLLTAGSSKLPVVVVGGPQEAPAYHVFDVAQLQAALSGQLSATGMAAALLLDGPGVTAVSRAGVSGATPGLPVVENGRLIGVTAEDVPDHPEPTEQDMTRGEATNRTKESGPKRGLWQRLTGSS